MDWSVLKDLPSDIAIAVIFGVVFLGVLKIVEKIKTPPQTGEAVTAEDYKDLVKEVAESNVQIAVANKELAQAINNQTEFFKISTHGTDAKLDLVHAELRAVRETQLQICSNCKNKGVEQ